MSKIRLYVEVTSLCNLKCAYCFEGFYEPHVLGIDSFCKFYDKISNAVSDVVITGGEPFLHEDIYSLIERVAIHVPVVVTTNGCAVDVARLGEILARNPRVYIQVSFDSVQKSEMDLLRGTGVSQKAIELLDSLSNYKEQVSISTTVVKANIGSVPSLLEFVRNRGLKVYFPELIPHGRLRVYWDKLMPSVDEYIKFEDYLLSQIVDDSNAGLVTSNKIDRILSRFFVSDDDVRTIKICANGGISVCPATDSVVARIEDISTCADLLTIFDDYVTCVPVDVPLLSCSNCEYESVCQRAFCGNCRYMSIEDSNILEYICKTYRHHLSNIANMGDLNV